MHFHIDIHTTYGNTRSILQMSARACNIIEYNSDNWTLYLYSLEIEHQIFRNGFLFCLTIYNNYIGERVSKFVCALCCSIARTTAEWGVCARTIGVYIAQNYNE